jgi:hypothetical protein
MTLGEAFRGWRRRRDLRIWSKRGFPAIVERKYWSEGEYRRDAARLAASGYVEVTESPANVQDAVAMVVTRDENVYLGGRIGPFTGPGPSGPLFRVTYQHQARPSSSS